ncbi:hypothetical protein DF268_36850 [Streptomyces sp. V2]|uniref:Uncharacterized protein n=1 Tax=Streptomyces niveiscabiei TaxID=164115 RepID=A0ABW9HUJ0_9ACTN|nr:MULTISPECIES: hypothetical protein [unclassified Streptomyces]PWG08608.1 hypothetical protein DF268_36850 [Streptomyces sp. V2]QZZ28086.1 hypothetical protein A7X85_18960 [Streptomyces sp. ST1015]
MYHPDFHLPLHHRRTAELQAAATTHRLTHPPTPTTAVRVRLGWTLVELGLRLAAHPRPAISS